MNGMKIDDDSAKKLVEAVLDSLDSLCASAAIVKENCDLDVFETYRRNIGNLVSNAADVTLEPIFFTHPHLRQWAFQRNSSSS